MTSAASCPPACITASEETTLKTSSSLLVVAILSSVGCSRDALPQVVDVVADLAVADLTPIPCGDGSCTAEQICVHRGVCERSDGGSAYVQLPGRCAGLGT